MTALPSRVVIVHTREHVTATRAAASQTGVAVILLSAPHLASMGGPLYTYALMGDPSDLVVPILDCGDDPGLAWRAAEVGWKHILFRGSDALLEKARSALEQKTQSSFPRKRESMFFDELDPRLRGDDGFCMILTPNDLPTTVLDLRQTTREGEVLVEWIVTWMTA